MLFTWVNEINSINPLTLQINNTYSFHEGLFYKHEGKVSAVTDVLVGVIHVVRESEDVEKSLVWFLIPGSKRKKIATDLQKMDAYSTMLYHLQERSTTTPMSVFLVGFEEIHCTKQNKPLFAPIHTMERGTHGLHSLPYSVVNCVRYIQKCIMDDKKPLFVDMKEMVKDEFCEKTVEMLHCAIETKILDVQTDESLNYGVEVKRIKSHKMKLFTDIEVRKDLMRFLTFAYSSLEE